MIETSSTNKEWVHKRRQLQENPQIKTKLRENNTTDTLTTDTTKLKLKLKKERPTTGSNYSRGQRKIRNNTSLFSQKFYSPVLVP